MNDELIIDAQTKDLRGLYKMLLGYSHQDEGCKKALDEVTWGANGMRWHIAYYIEEIDQGPDKNNRITRAPTDEEYDFLNYWTEIQRRAGIALDAILHYLSKEENPYTPR